MGDLFTSALTEIFFHDHDNIYFTDRTSLTEVEFADRCTCEPIKPVEFSFTCCPSYAADAAKYIPKKILYNKNATIVFWKDGTKTVVKCSGHDEYDRFDGFTAALAKKIFGSSAKVRKLVKQCGEEQKEKKN